MFKYRTSKIALLTALLLFSVGANASTWTPLNPSSPGFSYSPTPADAILYFDGNITPQSPANIKTVTETQFGLTPNSLTYLSGCDSPTSSCTNATGGTSTGLFTNTFSSDVAFNYLAVHFGLAELLFHWDNSVTTFQFGDILDDGVDFRGISNYRAYGDPSAVPLPGAIWLFGSAVLGFAGFGRRNKI